MGDVIYYTTDGLGGCISARCGANGTIERGVHTCSPTTPTALSQEGAGTQQSACPLAGHPATRKGQPSRGPWQD